MRNAFVQALSELAEKDPKVIALLADNGLQVFDDYQKKFPKQFMNVGIAECNMMGIAAGMASCGLKPYVYTILPFISYRALEFVRNDICYQNLDVKIIGIGAGFAYSTLGPTHHGTEDISIMRALPHLTVISPCDPQETLEATRATHHLRGPVYLRIGKGKDTDLSSEWSYEKRPLFQISKPQIMKEGTDVVILGTGSILFEALKAHALLAENGISARVINVSTLKPTNEKELRHLCSGFTLAVSLEDHSISGGLGGLIAECFSEAPQGLPSLLRVGLDNSFCSGYGSVADLRSINHLEALSLVQKISTALTLLKERRLKNSMNQSLMPHLS